MKPHETPMFREQNHRLDATETTRGCNWHTAADKNLPEDMAEQYRANTPTPSVCASWSGTTQLRGHTNTPGYETWVATSLPSEVFAVSLIEKRP